MTYPYAPKRLCTKCRRSQPYEGLWRDNGRTYGKRCLICGAIE